MPSLSNTARRLGHSILDETRGETLNRHGTGEDRSVRERNVLVAQMLGWRPSAPTDEPRPYMDALTTVHLLQYLAAEQRITALRVDFDLWPDAWSVFFETTIAGKRDEIHIIGDTFQDAIAKGAWTLHDADIDSTHPSNDATRANSEPFTP